MYLKQTKKKLCMVMMFVIAAMLFTACNDKQSAASESKTATNPNNEQASEKKTKKDTSNNQTNNNDTENTPITSKLEGVSDEVYKQLLEHYFYLTTFTDMLIDNANSDEKSDMSWHEEHELYEEAVEYVESHDEDIYLMNVFPNPLLYEHTENPDNYTEEETNYIEMITDYMDGSDRMNFEDYTKLKAQLKEDLQVDESDNMFP